ncbi:MAG: hypothetical protein M3081_22100, partial [Gemmatimonadota bacterium]|nr:hypothetical protein [Gemmatimonadota bacterium]
LASALLPPLALAAPARAQRATSARAWLSSLALPATLRAPLVRAADASARGARDSADAIRALSVAASAALDAASRRELDRLADELAASAQD